MVKYSTLPPPTRIQFKDVTRGNVFRREEHGVIFMKTDHAGGLVVNLSSGMITGFMDPEWVYPTNVHIQEIYPSEE